MEKIKAGDTVRLKHSVTQGIKMTVENVYINHDGLEFATCVWFVSGELKRENIMTTALKAG